MLINIFNSMEVRYVEFYEIPPVCSPRGEAEDRQGRLCGKNFATNFFFFFLVTQICFAQWQPDVRLTDDPSGSLTSLSNAWCVASSGDTVHVVWQDERDLQGEIYYKNSMDSGSNWSSDVRLTNSTVYSHNASVAVSNINLHVVWEYVQGFYSEIYYKRSPNAGANWDSEIRLTNDVGFSNSSSVFVSDLIVHVVWTDTRNADHEIYYKRSQDAGESWQEDTRLTNATDLSWFPSVTVSGSIVHVVWKDLRDGNWEIYYKRDPTGNVTGIKNNDLEIPKEFSLYQNYPNPFNPSTRIKYQVSSITQVTIKVYDVIGNEIATLVNEENPVGTYELTWNAANLPSGVYFYQLKAGTFIQTKKMLLLK